MSNLARAAGLTGFVKLALTVGVDPYRIAADAGVPAAAFTDPDMKVSARAIDNMFEEAAARSGAEDFALRIAEGRKLSNLGAVGLAAREQPTLRKALTQMARYIWLQNDAHTLGLEETGDIAVLRVGIPAWGGRQTLDLALGVAMRVMRDLMGETWRPQEICFPYAAPSRLETYRRVFGRTPLFDQDFLGLVIDRADLDAPISRADPVMASQLARYLEQIAGGRGLDLRDKVREIIAVLLPNGDCTVERVASRLGMDRRTLHRKLAADGLTFSLMMNEARRDAAQAMLARNDRSFQAIGELLGFSSLSAFAHWFRRQFGCTASDFRARLLRAGQAPVAAAASAQVA